MRVFVAGASGAIGRPLVPKLVAAGHEVTGTTRSEERAEAIRAAGATRGRRGRVRRRVSARAVEAAPRRRRWCTSSPRCPPGSTPRKQGVYEPTNRVRTEGTRNLLDAAPAAGARRFVCQSIAFAYAPGRAQVKDGGRPAAWTTRPALRQRRRGAPRDGARRCSAAEGLEGVVLRYGFFYGPGTYYGRRRHHASEVRRRRFPIVGKGSGLFSFIHVDDAADATVAAVERGAPGSTTSSTTSRRRCASGCRCTPRRWARSRPGACRSGSRDRGRPRGDDLGDRAARRLERAGQARARLGAGASQLARRLPRVWISRSGRSRGRTRRSPPSPPARRSRSARGCA